ncbi:MAG: exodeoxyribonuclease VII large subunit [Gammaproteobacteria bacterium]|nr:MAG: exodeoxyribonuclease VII large subunit [Gammaproteobacteria bacterium]
MPQTPTQVLSVSELNREAKYLLETSFPLIWVEGEISNLATPGSGHIYFSLKDKRAQVRCAMFRNRNMRIRFKPQNGQKVMIQAQVSLFEGRGEFQLIVEQMQEAGIGDLHKKFELLKQKLEQEGLFAPEHKKGFTQLPEMIGVITSTTGAAIRDILSVLQRRYPLAEILIYPTLVQGKTAAPDICKAIAKAQSDNRCDLLIIARGGGSIEDLWPFNEEVVARKIFQCPIPIISGVGHETDFTICDFVADQRAPTPSAAAELITPDINEIVYKIDRIELNLRQLMEGRIYIHQTALDLLKQKLEQQKPANKIIQDKQLLTHLRHKLDSLMQDRLSSCKQSIAITQERLKTNSPDKIIESHKTKVTTLNSKLTTLLNNDIKMHKHIVKSLARNLNAVSPLNTIARGYSVLESKDKHVVTSVYQTKVGNKIDAIVADGRLELEVLGVRSGDS